MARSGAYLDAALTYPVTVDGSWQQPVEVVLGYDSVDVTVWMFNARKEPQTFQWVPPVVENVKITPPERINLVPGANRLTFQMERLTRATFVEDFTIRLTKPSGYNPTGGYTSVSFAGWDAWASGLYPVTDEELRIEVTAYGYPVGDPRFPLVPSALDTRDAFREYVMSGAGLLSPVYAEREFHIMTDRLYPHVVQGMNPQILTDPRFAPLRQATAWSDAFNYKPPGIGLYPPRVRRGVVADAYLLSALVGTEAGILRAFTKLGIDTYEVTAKHYPAEGYWHITIPEYVAAQFNPEFVGQFALYHVDGYSTVAVEVAGFNTLEFYTEISYAGIDFI